MPEKPVDARRVNRNARRASLGVAGAAAITLVLLHGSADEQHELSKHSIGVTCTDPDARVGASQNGNTVSFECIAVDGKRVVVDGLLNLIPNHSPPAQLPQYNDIVDFFATGNTTSYELDCAEGIARVTISEDSGGQIHNRTSLQ